MRRFHWQDDSYESHVIHETRALVDSAHPIHTKVALIEAAIADEERHITLLERQLETAPLKRRGRLLAIIELRHRAVGHFRMTVKSLVVQGAGPEALREYGVVPVSCPEAEREFPFMEYSS